MQRQRNTTAAVITIILFLFTASEQRAVPFISHGQDESQVMLEAPTFPTRDQLAPAQTNSTDIAAGGKKKPGAHHKRHRRLARSRSRRKSGRLSVPALAVQRLRIVEITYRDRTHHKLVITSFVRNPNQQARAIRHNINVYGVRYVLKVYRGSAAIRQIVRAYKANRGNQVKAQREMTRVIEAQVAKGIYVSDHLRGRAVDIRTRGRNGARLTVLQGIAREIGGKVFRERDHIHFKLA